MRIRKFINPHYYFILFTVLFSCNGNKENTQPTQSEKDYPKGTYGYDAAFLKKHLSSVIELQDEAGNAKLLLSADYQGRVMTTTAGGDSSTSFGWLNYELLSAKQKKSQFNPVGGEERFWIGPEGGQFSIYFKKGDSFDIAHWQVPAVIDTLSYDVLQSDKSSAVFSKKATLTNYSGTEFNINIERKVSLITKEQIAQKINLFIPANINTVGFKTINKITNTGNNNWSKETGLLSIWLLGMFTPSPQTTVLIPFHPFPNSRSYITDNYFGQIPPERLVVKDSVLYFTCDGKYRSKIGLSPLIAKPVAASFDFQNNVLTLILPQVEKDASYVNSKWEIQKQPYKGDVINSYNDGTLADGTQMGPFYEIESSSPALGLNKNQTGEYEQSTIHLQGDYNILKQITRQILSIDLDSINKK
ncbi:MAG: DUF6786 family protein [Ginsengibacter sp.]